MIERPFYLEALKNTMWNDSIKVITENPRESPLRKLWEYVSI